jgi:exosome complex RNA-binding protein Rrp4
MNPTTKDRTMWLMDVQAQLVSNLEETQSWYKKNVNEHQKEQPNFKVGDYV